MSCKITKEILIFFKKKQNNFEKRTTPVNDAGINDVNADVRDVNAVIPRPSGLNGRDRES